MKTLILTVLLSTISLCQMFDYTWPNGQETIYTIDILEQPTVPGFLNDYSAPGQKQWNLQVNWELNNLEELRKDLFEETRPYHQERIEFEPIQTEVPTYNNHYRTPEPSSNKGSQYWFQNEEYKKKVLFDF